MFKRVLTCPHCGNEQKYDLSDNVVDTSYYERQMGDETEYTIAADDLECDNCGKSFGVRGSIWTYPCDVVNCVELNPF